MKRLCTGIHTAAVAICVLLSAAACQKQTSAAGTNPHVQALVDGSSLASMVAAGARMSNAERNQLVDQVRRFYKTNGYALIWMEDGAPSRRARELKAVLGSAAENGLLSRRCFNSSGTSRSS